MRWMCRDCGRPHPKNSPPCKDCGSMDLVQTTEQIDDRALEPGEFEWRCKECGTRHPKNSPPCKKCGSMSFEKSPLHLSSNSAVAHQRGHGQTESASGSSSSRRALLGYGVAASAVLLGGGALIYQGMQTPTVDNVPGQADSASGIELSTAETMMLGRINDPRTTDLTAKEATDDASTYYTRYLVKNGYDSMDSDTLEQSFQKFGLQNWYAIRNRFTTSGGSAIDYYDSPSQLAGDVLDSWRSSSDTWNPLVSSEYSHFGADIHVSPNEDIYVTAVVSN